MKSGFATIFVCMLALSLSAFADTASNQPSGPKAQATPPAASPVQPPAQMQHRSAPVNPSPSAWAFGHNDTVYRNSPDAQPSQKSNAVDPSPFAWAFGHNDTVYKHPAPYSPTPRPPHCHGPSCGVRPAHWEWVQQSVWIPGYWCQKYYPARYEQCIVNGVALTQLVQAEHYENVFVPGYYDWRTTRIWAPASWNCGY